MILPPSLPRPPTGWIPDAPDVRDWGFVGSLLHELPERVSATGTIDYRAYDSPRVQLGNSCVGHALAASAYLCMAIAGTPITFPSPMFAYAGARILERAVALVDRGCQPRLAMTWARDRGLIAESRWIESSENMDAIPPLDGWEAAASLEAFYRISDGTGAADEVRSALARGYCPAFAMTVDDRWEQLGSGVYDGPGGEILGGHMQVVVGCYADVLIVRNQWGASWGQGGYGHITSSAFDRMARDIWVPTVSPEVI